MALLKAFVCQVVLFGLYKLFLEEVVEAHLVPDELTRNCIVGFVCLVCFGIQLYTDKPDEDYDEADENPKSEPRGATSTKKFEPSGMPATHETLGSNESNQATANTGIFAQFSPNVSDAIKANGTETSNRPASTVKTSYNQVTTNSVLNGFSETKVWEESDDDGIEIDQFVAKKSDKEKVEHLKTVEVKDAESLKAEYVTEEVKQPIADKPEEVEPIKGEDVEAIKSEDVMEEVNKSRTDELEAIKSEVSEADMGSKCLIADLEAEEVKSRAVEPAEVEPIKGEDVTEPEQLATVAAEDATEPEQLATVAAEDVTESGKLATVAAEDVTEPEQLATVAAVDVTEPEQLSTLAAEDVTEPEQLATVEAEDVTEPEQLPTVEAEDVTEPEQLATEAEDVMGINSEYVVEKVSQSRTNEEIEPEEVTEAVVESKCLIANGKAKEFEMFNPQGETEEVKQSTAIEDEIEATQSEEIEVVESECFSANGEEYLPTPYSDKNTNLKLAESSEAQMTNGIAEEPLNNIDSISPNIIEETKSKSGKDEGEIRNGQETILSSQPQEYTNDVKESLPSPQEISNTISISTKAKDLETDNKNAETTLITEVSQSEKLSVTRQKPTIAAEVCVAPITIDISFIYACH